jgi:hypothetical protein
MPKNGGSHNLQIIPFLILIHLNLIGYKHSHRDLSKYFKTIMLHIVIDGTSTVTHSWSRFNYSPLIIRGSTGREIVIVMWSFWNTLISPDDYVYSQSNLNVSKLRKELFANYGSHHFLAFPASWPTNDEWRVIKAWPTVSNRRSSIYNDMQHYLRFYFFNIAVV